MPDSQDNQKKQLDEDESEDEAPDTGSLSTGRKVAEAKKKEVVEELKRQKEQIREKRKKRHEKNKLQQDEKRKRLETLSKNTRISDSLLDAVSAEQRTKSLRDMEKMKAAVPAKHTTFDDDLDDDDDGDVKDEDSTVSLQQGVHVKTLKQELDKTKTVAQRAAEFRQKALYGGRVKRMDSKQMRVIKEKREQQHKPLIKW